MEEEKKEVVEEAKEEKVEKVEPVQQEQPKEVDNEQDVKNSLLAFIAAMIGIVLIETALGMLICGIISSSIVKKVQGTVEKKPHAVFLKVARITSKIEIIVGAILTALAVLGFLIWLIWFIIVVVVAGAAAADAAAESIRVLF